MKRLHLLLLFVLLPTLAQAGELSVFAASSLTEALGEVAAAYRQQQPNARIMLHFAGSQALATQIEQGAPADLFISANNAVMQRLEQGGLVGPARQLLSNSLVLATRPGLEPPLTGVQDLARAGLLLVIGNRQVPVGNYTHQLLNAMVADPAFGPQLVEQIMSNVVSEENMVKAIIAKLILGEADAGVVYRSDLTSAKARRLEAIELPARLNPRAFYPVARANPPRSEADSLLSFLFSEPAQAIFRRYGFEPGQAP